MHLLDLPTKLQSAKVCYFFFPIWAFFYEQSQSRGQQGKEEAISIAPPYHFHPLRRHLDIRQQLMQRAHLCTYLAAGLEP